MSQLFELADRVQIVLVEPSHPGNIGAVARAMKNMALNRLVLVNPRDFPHADAVARASGATDVLDRARCVDSLAAATAESQLIVGTSARGRSLPWPALSPRGCAEQSVAAAAEGALVSLVFGRERTGLTNEELAACQYHVQIPTNSGYSSLNLGMSVQIIAYELFLAGGRPAAVSDRRPGDRLATAQELEGLYGHFERALTAIGYLDPANPGLLLPRLRRLFGRCALETGELNILRGVLKAAEGGKKPRKK